MFSPINIKKFLTIRDHLSVYIYTSHYINQNHSKQVILKCVLQGYDILAIFSAQEEVFDYLVAKFHVEGVYYYEVEMLLVMDTFNLIATCKWLQEVASKLGISTSRKEPNARKVEVACLTSLWS
jgi:hypothetical protein